MIAALIFDFDGLLIDTETPAFESWRTIYAEFGQDLPFELWKEALGTSHGFDALAHLAALVGQPFDGQAVLERRSALKRSMAALQPLMPGVRALLEQARAQGLACALASSSPRAWVQPWLDIHQIGQYFACTYTADDVSRTKPWPDLFLSAAACLGVAPAACLVFEDSPNGILAARAAGMRCVAVPGVVTARLALPPADMILASLDALPLEAIIARLG